MGNNDKNKRTGQVIVILIAIIVICVVTFYAYEDTGSTSIFQDILMWVGGTVIVIGIVFGLHYWFREKK